LCRRRLGACLASGRSLRVRDCDEETETEAKPQSSRKSVPVHGRKNITFRIPMA